GQGGREAGRHAARRDGVAVSELAGNIVRFARVLRVAGLPNGPAGVLSALRAAASVNILRRDELYWALHAVLVRRPEDHDLFDQAFGQFFRDPFGADQALSMLLSKTQIPRRPAVSRRVAEALRAPGEAPARPSEKLELVATLTFSPEEVLRTRDFDQ